MTRRLPAERKMTLNIPLFLITLHRMKKSYEIFKLTRICHIAIWVEAQKAQIGLTQYYNCKKSAMSGLAASNLLLVCGVGAVTYTRNAWKGAILHRYRHAATAIWWTERHHIPPAAEAATTPRKRGERESHRKRLRLQRE
jgi:hypothetical protein